MCDTRFGMEEYHVSKPGSRSNFRCDYDRLVFSSPFRRLQNKTQIFPLPGSIFVHNRLTHSLEVACVGNSIATSVARQLQDTKYGKDFTPLDSIGEIVAAACLAHDLGNPPFGHSGEKAIASFFSEGTGKKLRKMFNAEQWNDLTRFDGNANAFRLLTHRFNGRRPGGFAMTYSTLASIVKYPWSSSLAGNAHKFGFFTTEKDDYVKVADELGITTVNPGEKHPRYARHPLVYIVEAADDICYEVMDIEDAHKLGWLKTDLVVDTMLNFFDAERQQHIRDIMQHVSDPNERICYLRSSVIGCLVEECTAAFVQNEDKLLNGTLQKPLISLISDRPRKAFEAAEKLSWQRIYCAPDVVDIELAGTRIISFLMDKLVQAVMHPRMNYSQLLLAKVPGQYQVDDPDLFHRVQAVVDHVSGMTDVYALDLYRKLNAMSLKINN